MNPLQLLAVLLACVYLASAILHGLLLAGGKLNGLEKAVRWTWRLSAFLHLGTFGFLWIRLGRQPFYDAWGILSATALFTNVLFGWSAWRRNQSSSGVFVLSAVFVLQLLSSSFGDWMIPEHAPDADPARVLHVVTVVPALACLLLSGIHGGLYLLLLRQMRRRHFGSLFDKLPNLDDLALMMRHAASAGFVCLALGLNLGIFMAHRDQVAGFNYTDPHVLLTIFLWLHFGIVALSGRIRAISAQRASVAAAFGLVALVLAIALPFFQSLTFHGRLGS